MDIVHTEPVVDIFDPYYQGVFMNKQIFAAGFQIKTVLFKGIGNVCDHIAKIGVQAKIEYVKYLMQLEHRYKVIKILAYFTIEELRFIRVRLRVSQPYAMQVTSMQV